MSTLHDVHIWISALLTLIVLSAMFKESRIYRAVESYFIGLSASVLAYYIITDVLYHRLIAPLLRGEWLYLIPLLLSIPIFFRKFPIVNRFTPWIVAAGIGVYIASIMTRIFEGLVVKQLALFIPVMYQGETVWSFLTSILSGVLATAVLFHFSPYKKTTISGKLFDSMAVISIVVALGVLLGYTVASYIALFVDRIYFLIETFLKMI